MASNDYTACTVGTFIVSCEQDSAVLDLLDGHGVQKEPVLRNRNGFLPTPAPEPRCLGVFRLASRTLDSGVCDIAVYNEMRPGTVLRHDPVTCRAGRRIAEDPGRAPKRMHLDLPRF